MQCELCSHEVDENKIQVLEIYNDYYGETDRFWACPDCVDESEDWEDYETIDEAKNEIKRLLEENARLREELDKIHGIIR